MIYAGYRFWEKEKKKGRGSDLPLGPHSGPTRRPGRKERGLASREIGPGRPGGGGLLAVGLVLLGLGWCWARPSSEEAGRGTRALLAAARGGVDGPRPLSLSPALFGSRCTDCTQVVLSPFPSLLPLSHGAQGNAAPGRRSGDHPSRPAPPSFHTKERTDSAFFCSIRTASTSLSLPTAAT